MRTATCFMPLFWPMRRAGACAHRSVGANTPAEARTWGPHPGRRAQKLMLPIIPAMLVVSSLIVGAIVDDAM